MLRRAARCAASGRRAAATAAAPARGSIEVRVPSPAVAAPAPDRTHSGADCPLPAGGERIVRGIGRLSNIVVERASGSWVWTKDGEKYLDFSTGIGVCNLGHCHPKVVAAAHAQLDRYWHAQVNISFHDRMLGLTEKLVDVMPQGSDLDTFFFWNSGAEAVEAAVKLARHATKRPNIITFQGGYHGRTLLTMSMTTSKTIFRSGFGPHNAGIHVAPFPHRGWDSASALEQLETMMLQSTAPEETAAVVIEPVLGEGGYVPAPPEFLAGLRAFCDRHGVLLIADEVQTGFGRTGRMFAMEHSGVHPDVLVFAKGIANGLPLSGFATRRELSDRQPPGSQGGTYAGNAVACAAAEAVLDVLADGAVLRNCAERGRQLSDGLRALQRDGAAPIVEVRGDGLMIGMELDAKAVPKGTAAAVSKACLARGLILLNTGCWETLRLIPPLTVSAAECSAALGILREALAEVLGAPPAV